MLQRFLFTFSDVLYKVKRSHNDRPVGAEGSSVETGSTESHDRATKLLLYLGPSLKKPQKMHNRSTGQLPMDTMVVGKYVFFIAKYYQTMGPEIDSSLCLIRAVVFTHRCSGHLGIS